MEHFLENTRTFYSMFMKINLFREKLLCDNKALTDIEKLLDVIPRSFSMPLVLVTSYSNNVTLLCALNAAKDIFEKILTACFNVTVAAEIHLAPQGLRLWFAHCMLPLCY